MSQVFESESQRLLANVNKYTTLNIPKNTGWRKNTLQMIESVVEDKSHLTMLSDRHIEIFHQAIVESRVKPERLPNVIVMNFDELKKALSKAKAGDVIEFPPEVISINRKLTLNASGSLDAPITIQGSRHGNTTLEITSMVGLQISGANVIIDNITFSGKCKDDSHCEHALQLKGNADNVEIRNSDFLNFNAAIKSSGIDDKKTQQREHPDYVNIHQNTFVNDWSRDTKQAVTPIDVVGGDFWTIERNFFADFEKKRGNKISYGAFLKGGGNFGQFVDNVVACEWKVPYSSKTHVRIGLSFGGGGTSAQFCPDKVCSAEHQKGVMDHNLIVNCPTDVGIYINNGHDILLSQNVVFGTLGIDVNRGSAGVDIINNKVEGLIRWRNESVGVDNNNPSAEFQDVKSFTLSKVRSVE